MKSIYILLLISLSIIGLVHGDLEQKYLKDLYEASKADNSPVDVEESDAVTTESSAVTESSNETKSSTTRKQSNVTVTDTPATTTIPAYIENISLEIRFANFIWTDELNDPTSNFYSSTISDMEKLLRNSLNNYVIYRVVFSNLRQGSVIADTKIITDQGVKPDEVVKELNKDKEIHAEINGQTTPKTPTTNAPSGGLQTWTIIVIVICAVLFVLLITLVVVSLINRHRNRGHMSFGTVEMEKMQDESLTNDGRQNIAYTED